MISTLLIPVDGSAHSRRAIEMAAELARNQQADVLLLHVIRNLSLPKEILDMIASGEVTESRQELLENSAQIILENAAERLRNAGVEPASVEFVYGSPATTIVEYVQAHQAFLFLQ